MYILSNSMHSYNFERLWLAVLHFNENYGRDQARTKDGTARYKIAYPKFKKGEYTVRKISVECTYGMEIS
jgi:hypothetical protein